MNKFINKIEVTQNGESSVSLIVTKCFAICVIIKSLIKNSLTKFGICLQQ